MKVSLPTLVGVSPAIGRLRREVADAAGCDAKVLITGESGVGKEVVADLIHGGSARASQRLVAVNCAAVTETLLETELFGHVRGAFTDAHRDRLGMLEVAHRGTVFLDEIGEMSPRMQGMLLRFLETGEVQRVGADHGHRRVDVRVIAATNRNLASGVSNGSFRADLFYRLNILAIEIPPLRERREDIPLLLQEFIDHFASRPGGARVQLSKDAMAALCQYDWPGNVRELKNVIERVIARGMTGTVHNGDLPPEIGRGGGLPEAAAAPPPPRPLADDLYERVVVKREDFWDVVHTPFMSRDLTRADIRALIARGLRETSGSYRQLVALFGMPPEDYKRLLGFLRKYQCQMPLQPFRSNRPSAA
jgi:transcriptional regulator with PAS, ATPase and Fis domain